ncbi:MAG: hypothetical protein F4X61_06100 [Rhodothermaceae bacterium]|nr:hypothetical protein [Rhodothermaceae bacterium]MXW33291.1 hypothetical protein [Rhodothermaceae bacterium]MYC04185.1 hypothetical protein [Rhodothermaceae bacterium]MYE64290.1 hypothetical protein [Rhodothermaceae bacterium]MYJ20650.1 hypothetical protein [Rhodothermaceae bacterium]
MRLRGQSRFEEDGLSWERLSDGMIESNRFVSGLGGQEIFCIGAAIANERGLHLAEFGQDLSLAQSLFCAKEGIVAVA